MPALMRALLAVIVVQIVIDVVALATSTTATAAELTLLCGAIGVDATVAALLARGSDRARALVRMAAGLGMAVDAWLLLTTIVWSPPTAARRVAIATAAILFVCSAATFVVLGAPAVRTWMFERWMIRRGFAL
jgi:hypothetical protein